MYQRYLKHNVQVQRLLVDWCFCITQKNFVTCIQCGFFLEFPQKFRLNYLVYIRKSKVENLQTEYFLMYRQYLKHAYSKEANTQFVGGLMLLHHSK